MSSAGTPGTAFTYLLKMYYLRLTRTQVAATTARTPHAHRTHTARTPHAHCAPTARTPHAHLRPHRAHTARTPHPQCMPSACTAHAQRMHSAHTLHAYRR